MKSGVSLPAGIADDDDDDDDSDIYVNDAGVNVM